jgi:hypothetical protein
MQASTIPCSQDLLPHVRDAQHIIGWGCFLEGSLATTWMPVQAQHFALLGLRCSSKVWARGLIQQLGECPSACSSIGMVDNRTRRICKTFGKVLKS